MTPPSPWVRAAALAGALVLILTGDASAQQRDGGRAAEEADDDDEGEVLYEDEDETADDEIGPGDASISGGGLGCALSDAQASGAIAPLLVAGLLMRRRRRRPEGT